MDASWTTALQQLGVTQLSPLQERVVGLVMGPVGLRLAVVLPTGSGKSLCFQLPALLLPHPTLVIFPLRSLLADQARRCRQLGVEAALFQGGQTHDERSEQWSRLESGRARLVLTNPETLLQPRLLKRLSQVHWSHVAIDEAHCYTLWGQTFRPSYRELPQALERLWVDRVSAFTATASQRVLDDWASLFGGQRFELVRGNADRPNLDFARVSVLSPRAELPQLVAGAKRPALVFCRSRDRVRHWAHHLHRETGLDVRFYHAGLTRDEKQGVERWFFDSRDGVLVATNAYGMGVDKPDIRTVFHLEYPPSTEDYLQEAGRAGRDGRPGRCLLVEVASPLRSPTEGCWRRHLLTALDSVPERCAGCDVCRGQRGALPATLTQACRALARTRGILDRRECLAFLRGHEGVLGTSWSRVPGWAHWQRYDDLTVHELWSALCEQGWLEWGNGSRGLLRRIVLV